MHIIAIVAAGGRGMRFGADRPKQFLELGGRPILQWSVAAFARHPRIREVLVALPSELASAPPAWLHDFDRPVRILAGGARRQDSVERAFLAAGSAGDLFVIHDAARPLVEPSLIDRVIDAAAASGAAIAALPARDTVKVADVAHEAGRESPVVLETIDRARVWLAQTPQAFTRRVLEDAVAQGRAGVTATDEAALAERAGHAVRLVAGSPHNVKITTPVDLVQAESWVASGVAGNGRASGQAAGTVRIGIGYDSHRLVEGRPLVLGGVAIPHGRGPAAHSDGDALCHAITDAVLGAAALGDIGRHFPDSDERWKDADSVELLRRAVALVQAAGFLVESADAVVIAERPKLAPYLDEIRASLAAALAVDSGAVSVKGKTNEGMGETGRGEAIAVHAVALLSRRGS